MTKFDPPYPLKSNALTEGVAWLFEALRATDYFDERILRSHERLPMPERAKMARAYYDVLPPYEQILIYRAASLPNARRAGEVSSDGTKIGRRFRLGHQTGNLIRRGKADESRPAD
jgi:hypothetical protein